jgi:hypothetical protein
MSVGKQLRAESTGYFKKLKYREGCLFDFSRSFTCNNHLSQCHSRHLFSVAASPCEKPLAHYLPAATLTSAPANAAADTPLLSGASADSAKLVLRSDKEAHGKHK